jgi:hypothetical protein
MNCEERRAPAWSSKVPATDESYGVNAVDGGITADTPRMVPNGHVCRTGRTVIVDIMSVDVDKMSPAT